MLKCSYFVPFYGIGYENLKKKCRYPILKQFVVAFTTDSGIAKP